jgi:cytochrome c biogenesis protein CcmG/thiol:disulfide interchange protein DsbE
MKFRYLIPVVIFVGLLGLFAIGLNLDPHEVPSPLIDKPIPEFTLPRLDAPDRTLGSADLRKGDVVLLNVWASDCTSCRAEHDFLMELAARHEVTLYGLNWKDQRADALAILTRTGNPYAATAFDPEGRVGIDWGVYGTPETFVIDGSGRIRYKQIGPLSPDAWQRNVEPVIRQIKAERQ